MYHHLMWTLLKCSDMLIIMKLSIPPSSSISLYGFHLEKLMLLAFQNKQSQKIIISQRKSQIVNISKTWWLISGAGANISTSFFCFPSFFVVFYSTSFCRWPSFLFLFFTSFFRWQSSRIASHPLCSEDWDWIDFFNWFQDCSSLSNLIQNKSS